MLERKPPPRQLIAYSIVDLQSLFIELDTKFLQLPVSRYGKNSVKKFLDPSGS